MEPLDSDLPAVIKITMSDGLNFMDKGCQMQSCKWQLFIGIAKDTIGTE